MKRIIFICGITAGLISSLWSIYGDHFLGKDVSLNARIWFGYASMVVAFSLIFIGVKNYRDQFGNGSISFGKALKIALLITIIASTVYTVGWMINFYYFLPDFGEKYMAAMRAQLIAKGVSAAEMNKQMADMQAYMQQYKNPFYNAMATYAEILPVGITMSLLCAALLKRKAQVSTSNN